MLLHLAGEVAAATLKARSHVAAGIHAVVYSLPFLMLEPSLAAFLVILVSHFLIDRFALARYVVWLKNYMLNPKAWCRVETDDAVLEIHRWQTKYGWKNCQGTGYPAEMPPWLTVWLYIVADNTIHLTINYLALRYL